MLVSDFQFNYAFFGDRRRPLVLFLHGFMGRGDDFAEIIDLLIDDFCCLTVDLPGHGDTKVQHDFNYQMQRTAQGLMELLGYLEVKSCLLVGYSMGGRLALYLTIYFPDYFQGVVLESASPGLKTLEERDRRIQQDLQLAQQLTAQVTTQDLGLFLQRWYGNPLFESFRQHPLYQNAIAQKKLNNPDELAKSLTQLGLGKQPSFWHLLSTNQVPILLLAGEFDSKFKLINQQIADICDQSSLQVVSNSGHNIHFEQPQEFAKLIRSFWQNLTDRKSSCFLIKD